MSLNINPIGDRVVVLPTPIEQKTKSGIFLTGAVQDDKPLYGTVVAVGNSKTLTVKEGDEVLYSKYSGSAIAFEEKEYLIMRETDIYAVIGNRD